MEILSGGVVKKKIVCKNNNVDILRLFKKVVEAVHYAHLNGVLHRDIKPSNILLNGAGVPHIADFGIAKLLEDDQKKSPDNTARHMGTPAYTAPELINGDRDQPDVRSEIYSLGVLLFELLTGQHPFGSNSKSLASL